MDADVYGDARGNLDVSIAVDEDAREFEEAEAVARRLQYVCGEQSRRGRV